MSREVSSPAAKSGAAPPPAKSGSAVRLLILLALLALVIGMWYYDYAYAGPGSDKGHSDVQAMVEERNAKSATESDLVRSKDVQEVLKFGPTFTKSEKDHTVEYYCWWGPIPGLNTWKRYVTVLYVGNEPRRFQSVYLNQPPPAEDLPGYVPPMDPNAVAVEPAMEGTEPGGEAPAEPSAEEGGAKKKGKGRGGKAPEGDAPAGVEPSADAPTSDKPAESDKPAAEETDKPAADDDATKKPAEGDDPKPAADPE